jgi:flagella basal body P-ring formation protein FlgA
MTAANIIWNWTIRVFTVGLCALAFSVAARAERIAFLVPSQIIYPGQTIGNAGLTEKFFTIRASAAAQYVLSPDQLVGKISRRTLLPGQPILLTAVNEPDMVQRGVPAVLIYDTGSLVITARGTPLEAGRVGDFIKVRNLDSGITVSGTILADGRIQVGMQ